MGLPLLSLQKDLINLGVGVYPAGKVIHCESDTGSIELIWDDDSVTPYDMTKGEDRATYDVKSIEIKLGIFTMANQ